MPIFNREQNQETNKLKRGIIILSVILAIYLILSIIFMFFTYPTTKINGRNIPFKKIHTMFKHVDDYKMELIGRDGRKVKIDTKQMGIKGRYTGKAVYSQNGFLWPYQIFRNNNVKVNVVTNIDQKKLENSLTSTELFKNIVEPKDAKIVIKDQKPTVIKEVMGNKLDLDKLKNSVIDHYKLRKNKIILKKEYNDPVAYEKELTTKLVDLKTMAKSKITLILPDGNKEELDVTKFLNDKHEYEQVKIREYIDELKKKFDNVGIDREFKTSGGNTIQVSGGIFGIEINKPESVALIEKDLKEGKTATEDLVYTHKSINEGKIGNSYIEISLSDQYMWFYKNGEVVVETPVVTGTAYSHPTPRGVYEVWIKETNRYLEGPNGDGTRYKVPVQYWMQVDYTGIGLHDTYYRGSYGGSIYRYNGSHGCINTPLKAVSNIYNSVDFGTPVIIY